MKTFGQHISQEPQVSKLDKLTETSPTLEFKTDYTVRHNSALAEDPELTLESLLTEIDFGDKAAFMKYNAKHKMRPTTKVHIAGKQTTAKDADPDAFKDDEKDKEEPEDNSDSLKAKPLKREELNNAQDKTSADRDKGIAGAGGQIASQGESRYCDAVDKLDYEKFNGDNEKEITKETASLKDRKYPTKDEERTLKSVGFDNPNSPEAKKYIASREVWATQELERIKAIPEPNVFTKSDGFNKNPEAYKIWMHAAYDGAHSTKQRLKESRMDTSKPHKTIQSTGKLDDQVQADLKHKIENSEGEDKKHYENELKHFKKNREYHDTYVVGEDEKGRTFIVSVSNKKNSDMKDTQNNTTPAQRLTTMKKEFGPKTAKAVSDAMDRGVERVTSVNETSIKDSSEIKIDDDYASVAEVASPKRVKKIKEAGTKRGRTKSGKPKRGQEFGVYLEDNKISEDDWNKMSTAEQLQQSQKFTADDDWHKKNGTKVTYDPYAKVHIKVGEVSTGGHRQLNKVRAELKKKGIDPSKSDSVKTAGDLKNNEANAVNEAHQGVIDEIGKADEGLGKDGKNGPHTQAYVGGVMDGMHIGTYINTPEGDDDKMLIQMGSNAVKPSHYRKTLAEATGFKGDLSTPEGKKALEQHIKDTATLEMDEEGKYTGSIVIKGKDGGKDTKLFEDTWRTAGTSQKVASGYGDSTREGLIEAAKGDGSRLSEEKMMGFNEWIS